jgi:hypothetical protein
MVEVQHEPPFSPFGKLGELRRDLPESAVAALSDEQRAKYLALVTCALNVEDSEAQLKADEQALYAAVDNARVTKELLEAILPKTTFAECLRLVQNRPREQY